MMVCTFNPFVLCKLGLIELKMTYIYGSKISPGVKFIRPENIYW